jgi:threonine dehydrogenase-like Zn-dependent dehydrogenase
LATRSTRGVRARADTWLITGVGSGFGEGRIEPGRVFDRTTDLDGVPDGYRAMNEREAIKVLIEL